MSTWLSLESPQKSFFFFNFRFSIYFLHERLAECMFVWYFRGQKRALSGPGTGVTNDWEPPYGCWGLYPGPSAKAATALNCWAISPAIKESLFLLVGLFFRDKVSLCSPGCPGTCCLDHVGFKLRDPQVCLLSTGIKDVIKERSPCQPFPTQWAPQTARPLALLFCWLEGVLDIGQKQSLRAKQGMCLG